jgi:lipopolysaccharide export system protein LptC
MTTDPLPARSGPVRRPGQRLAAAAAGRVRPLPNPDGLARRRIVITLTKWLLPAAALLLLATVALWPQLDRARDTARIAFQRMGQEVGGARVTDARYHGVDEKGRPYTVTAATAQQDGPDRINLTVPKADITLEDGTWLMLQARQGVYLHRSGQLDLSQAVTLYRDDGTTVVTASASVDLKNGAAASSDPTHAEGPFGMLDSEGFTLTEKGGAIQFAGPARLVLNGSSP